MQQSSTTISERMRNVKGRDTKPEMQFRKALWARGFRYSICMRRLPGKPDIVFPKKRVVIFIDGDFWHGMQWKKRGFRSLKEQFVDSASGNYWTLKISRNMHRDCIVTAKLIEDGWKVVRFWESDIKNNMDGCLKMAVNVLEEKNLNYQPTMVEKTVAEFFAGIGLMRMGLEKQGWRTIFANDIDSEKEEMYRGNYPGSGEIFICDDIHHLNACDIPNVTLATASFPCNDLSLAGSRNGLKGKQSSAYWGFIKILRDMGHRKPPIILLENVTGFLTSHGGKDFADALLALNDLSYAVDAFIIDAARFVPQSRQRLFVVAHQEVEPQESLIAERNRVFYESDVRPRALADIIFTNPYRIRWKIRDLPDPPRNGICLQNILEELPFDSPEWWSESRVEYLLSQMSPRHRAIAQEMMSSDTLSYGTIFRRVRNGKSMAELRTDGIAGCLRTPRGGSGRQILFVAGKNRSFARLLTPRECARLMGADDFHIDVSLNQALFGFGDAVCVPVVEWIAQHYLNPLLSEMLRGRILNAK